MVEKIVLFTERSGRRTKALNEKLKNVVHLLLLGKYYIILSLANKCSQEKLVSRQR